MHKHDVKPDQTEPHSLPIRKKHRNPGSLLNLRKEKANDGRGKRLKLSKTPRYMTARSGIIDQCEYATKGQTWCPKGPRVVQLGPPKNATNHGGLDNSAWNRIVK
mmetsp:Transcript_149326/g.278500  ORF Transcript_149326/g.278500 Transcript_149326/m.278500 type:complete len:105 (-) Transcript_149326:12-326(-)